MKKKLIAALLFCMMLVYFTPAAFAAEKEKYPYYVTVNLTDNIVTVYEKDEAGKYTVPMKAFLCSVGKSTPEGTFQTMVKYDWRALFGNVWGQYATRITGSYLFHSVPYLEKDPSTLEYYEYNKLGKTASMGCVRLTVEDAKWIYDNCPIGTTVKMYRGNVEEPLKPAPAQKLNVNDLERRGWDPTDKNPANPWRKGELRDLQVAPALLDKTIETYYENGVYYISAAEAEDLFSRVGAKFVLPEVRGKGDERIVLIEGMEHKLNCREKEGEVYYKMRDLATLGGVEMIWDNATKNIDLVYGEKKITIGQDLPVKEEASLSEKVAALFQG